MPLTKLSTAVKRQVEDIGERVAQGGVEIIGIPTGFYKIDTITGGLRNDAVYVLAGRPGMGKTALGMSMAMNIARADYKVLFLSLEMSAELLALRTISGLTGIASDEIERGKLDDEQYAHIVQMQNEFDKLQFAIVDDSLDSETFIDYAKGYQEKHGLDALFVDYISLFRDPINFGNVERIGRISRNVREIARVCNIPVVALAQLNREVEKREGHMPILSDLRDSGDIEQDAFVVFFVLRPHYYAMLFDGEDEVKKEGDAKIIIAKNRQGRTAQTTAVFYPDRMLWEQKPPDLVLPPQTLAEKVKRGRS